MFTFINMHIIIHARKNLSTLWRIKTPHVLAAGRHDWRPRHQLHEGDRGGLQDDYASRLRLRREGRRRLFLRWRGTTALLQVECQNMYQFQEMEEMPKAFSSSK